MVRSGTPVNRLVTRIVLSNEVIRKKYAHRLTCMRSSNSEDGLNFHLRMIVQRMIDPPTVAAITISIVIVVFEIPLEAAEVAFAVSVALASEAPEVPVTVAVKTDVDNC